MQADTIRFSITLKHTGIKPIKIGSVNRTLPSPQLESHSDLFWQTGVRIILLPKPVVTRTTCTEGCGFKDQDDISGLARRAEPGLPSLYWLLGVNTELPAYQSTHRPRATSALTLNPIHFPWGVPGAHGEHWAETGHSYSPVNHF